jgi:hypothetical protein
MSIAARALIDQIDANVRDGLAESPVAMLLKLFDGLSALGTPVKDRIDFLRVVGGDDFILCIVTQALVGELQRRLESQTDL